MSKRLYLTQQSYWDLPDDTDLDALHEQIRSAMSGAGDAVIEVPVVQDWARGRLLLNARETGAVLLLDNNPIDESRIAH